MKKIGIVLLFIFGFNSVSADCMYQEIDPVCSVTWQTFTNSCEGLSDTSSWSLPKAYDGTCNTTLELTNLQKEKIHDIMVTFLDSKEYLEKRWEWYVLTWDSHWWGELSGIDFISNSFFPAVANYIAKENMKLQPNIEAIAIFNEASKLIWYDWYIEKQ